MKVPFVNSEPSSIDERKQILNKLIEFLEDHEDDLVDALKEDLNRVRNFTIM